MAKILFDMMYDNRTHIAFTGGEPMMKAAQKNIIKVIHEIKELFKTEHGYYGKAENGSWTYEHLCKYGGNICRYG